MSEGLMDMFVSRRTAFNECYYYKKFTNGVNGNTLMYNDEPAGCFAAEEVNSYSTDSQQVGSLRTRSEHITLKTLDDISGTEIDDLVLYDDNKWRVTNIQKTKITKENQFMREVHWEYYISLKR